MLDDNVSRLLEFSPLVPVWATFFLAVFVALHSAICVIKGRRRWFQLGAVLSLVLALCIVYLYGVRLEIFPPLSLETRLTAWAYVNATMLLFAEAVLVWFSRAGEMKDVATNVGHDP